MARDRLDVAKKQHRERGQLKHRQRLGLLEKHQDYVKRARDFHSKEDRIKKLREKAATRNKDEFYFGMVRSRTERGVHIQENGNESMPVDVVKLLKTQDVGYVRTLLSTEEKLINRLKTQLQSIVAFQTDAGILQAPGAVDSSDDDEDASAAGRGEGTSKQAVLDLLLGGGQAARGNKTVFVDSAREVEKYRIKPLPAPPRSAPAAAAAASANKKQGKGKGKGKGTVESDSLADSEAAARSVSLAAKQREANVSRMATELSARQERLALLQRTFREMQVQRAIMGNGSKSVVGNRSKGVDREAERLNEKDLDELEIKQLGSRKKKLPEPQHGIRTGARVWKWKAERRR